MALVGILALSLIFAFVLILLALNYLPMLIIFGIVLAVIAFFWFPSHRHVDDKSLPPALVKIKDGNSETTVSMHPRGLPSSEQLDNFEKILSMVQHQRLLPEPDGLVDQKGTPVPESKEEARQIIDAVNSEVKKKFDAMNMHPNDLDQPNETMQSGAFVEPKLEDIKETNRPNEK